MPSSIIKQKTNKKLHTNKNQNSIEINALRDTMYEIIPTLTLNDNEEIELIHNSIYYNIRLSMLDGTSNNIPPLYEYRVIRWNTNKNIQCAKTLEKERLIINNNNNPIWVEKFWCYPKNTNGIGKDISYYYKKVYSLSP